MNDPTVETGPGDRTSPDWDITGALTLEVRAELANNDSRTYTVVVSTTDKSGNSTTDSVTVVVQKNKNAADEIATGAAAKKVGKAVGKAVEKRKK